MLERGGEGEGDGERVSLSRTISERARNTTKKDRPRQARKGGLERAVGLLSTNLPAPVSVRNVRRGGRAVRARAIFKRVLSAGAFLRKTRHYL